MTSPDSLTNMHVLLLFHAHESREFTSASRITSVVTPVLIATGNIVSSTADPMLVSVAATEVVEVRAIEMRGAC